MDDNVRERRIAGIEIEGAGGSVVISHSVVREGLTGVTFEWKLKRQWIHALSRGRAFQADETATFKPWGRGTFGILEEQERVQCGWKEWEREGSGRGGKRGERGSDHIEPCGLLKDFGLYSEWNGEPWKSFDRGESWSNLEFTELFCLPCCK